jgi:LmbE family N-acetylglucosaminyl deacetylase
MSTTNAISEAAKIAVGDLVRETNIFPSQVTVAERIVQDAIDAAPDAKDTERITELERKLADAETVIKVKHNALRAAETQDDIRKAISAFAPTNENIMERTPLEALNCLFYRIVYKRWKSDEPDDSAMATEREK